MPWTCELALFSWSARWHSLCSRTAHDTLALTSWEYDSDGGSDRYGSDGYGYDSDQDPYNQYNDLCVDCHRPCFVPDSYLGNTPRCYRCR